jgi:hypothetical protein
MPDEIQAPAPQSAAIPANGADWRATLVGDDATAFESLKGFEAPTDFFKSYQTTAAELKALKETPTTFDWRKEIAGEDEKAAKLLERYSSPKDFGKAYLEAQNKIRTGELAKPLPKNATPEQITEWRAANGIPEKPEQYFEKLPNGRVIGKDDLPRFTEVAAKIHAANASPEVMNNLVEWYYDMADKETAALSESEKRDARTAEDALREAWGNDFRANENHLSNYMEGLPEGLKNAFGEGFGPDGRKLMHNPEFKQWLSNIAREFNPLGMVTPGGNESAMASLHDEIAKLSAMSAKNPKEYWGTKNEARHKELITQREKLKPRMAQ